MTEPSPNALTIDFEWLPEHDELLDQVATTDVVDAEWTTLRNMIKYKLDKNIAMFLATKADEVPPPPWAPGASTPGGLKLPPFPTRERNNENPNEAPKADLTELEASEAKEHIFAQLHEFESSPPFTIQRVCELCIRPKQHYKKIGKYLRAFEKVLLVTSGRDAFPALPDEKTSMDGTKSFAEPSFFPTRDSSVPSTPLFSPIPFLHDDARRSKSRSPPPLVLNADSSMGEPSMLVQSENSGLETKALGLVDELDDPSPGHLSDHPTALTSVTTVTETGARPLFSSLEERFTRAASPGDEMELDPDTEDKENKA